MCPSHLFEIYHLLENMARWLSLYQKSSLSEEQEVIFLGLIYENRFSSLGFRKRKIVARAVAQYPVLRNMIRNVWAALIRALWRIIPSGSPISILELNSHRARDAFLRALFKTGRRRGPDASRVYSIRMQGAFPSSASSPSNDFLLIFRVYWADARPHLGGSRMSEPPVRGVPGSPPVRPAEHLAGGHVEEVCLQVSSSAKQPAFLFSEAGVSLLWAVFHQTVNGKLFALSESSREEFPGRTSTVS